MVERKKFGPIGWNRPYEFNDTYFFISLSQLQTCINHYNKIPFDLLQYLIGKLNYGGKITLKQDEETFMAILETFINERVLTDERDNYYQAPKVFSLQHFKKKVREFPQTDRPDIFGLDENATIIRDQNEAKTLLEKVFELEFASKNLIKTAGGEEESDEMVISKFTKDKMHKIITELPDLLNEEDCKRKFPISYQE